MIRLIMTAIGKAKPLPLNSGSGMNGVKSQVRSFQSQSSPVYKTQERSSGVRGIKDRNGFNRARRGMFGLGGGNEKVTLKSLEDVAEAMKNEIFQNIVVVAGAGISTPSGIPDFRSPGTGLYDNLKQYRIPYPEAIFDIEFFHHNPKPFFTLAKELYPTGKYRPNFIHYFVRLLHDKGLLLRMYTQNIDGLERIAGLPADKMVEAHGTFSEATCVICRQKQLESDVRSAIFNDRLPKCKSPGCPGIVKPDITFFGEDLPQRFYFYLKDMLQADLVIVMGTSLEVQPFAGIVDTVRWGVPRVLFNMQAVGPFKYQRRVQDFISPGDLINSVQKFSTMAGWKNEMVDLITKEEGKYVVCSPDYAKKMKEFQNRPPPKEPPIRMWRQPAKLNLFSSESESSSSEVSESESDSSDEDDRWSKNLRNKNVRKGWGVANSAPRTSTIKKNNSEKNGKPNGTINGKRHYSTDAQLTTRSDRGIVSDPNRSTLANKAANEINHVTSKFEKFNLRRKSSTPDSGKGKRQRKGIRRTVSDRNIKNFATLATPKSTLERSNSAKVSSKKSDESKSEKKLDIKKSVSDSQCGNCIRTGEEEVLSKSSLKPSNDVEVLKTEGQVDNMKQESEMENNWKAKGAMNKSSKPPLPQNQKPKKPRPPALNALNARPYGYLAQKKLPHRPTVQANLVNSRSLYGQETVNDRPSSAQLPRITYRHKLKPSYDARIFAIRVADSSSDSSCDGSSEESR